MEEVVENLLASVPEQVSQFYISSEMRDVVFEASSNDQVSGIKASKSFTKRNEVAQRVNELEAAMSACEDIF